MVVIQVQLRVSSALLDISHQRPRSVHVCRGTTITFGSTLKTVLHYSDCVYIVCDYSIPGTFARELRSTACAQCTSGKSSPSGSSSCIDCQAGKFKYVGKQFYQLLNQAHFTCILCCDRFVNSSPVDGSSSCSPCAAGLSSKPGSSYCSECAGIGL